MDEREAARNGGLLAQKFRGTDFEVAGTGFGDGRHDSPLVALVQAAPDGCNFVRTNRLLVISESTNQHAVSIAVKAVACLNSMVVSSEDFFAACECADQR